MIAIFSQKAIVTNRQLISKVTNDILRKTPKLGIHKKTVT